MADKIAIVTGGNRGIGFGIVRELCRRGVGTVYLTTRDEKKGQEALDKLKKEGYVALLLKLEVTDKQSVQAAADTIKAKHGGFDILINNAGITQINLYENLYDEAKRIIEVNYRSIQTIEKAFFPLLKENGRVINLSSDCGHIANLRNDFWIKRLTSPNVSLADVDEFVNWYLDSLKILTLKEEDFAEMPALSYRISKIALTALTRVQQKEVKRNISVNALHPGFVKTDMTLGTGYLTVDEAKVAPTWLALDAPQSLKGEYIWYDKTVKDWNDAKSDLYCHFYTLGDLIAATEKK